MKIFKELLFRKQEKYMPSGKLKNEVVMKAYVPGVNSGAYSKQLHITVRDTRPFSTSRWMKFKFGCEQVVCTAITLDERQMRELRDEINKILRLPFDKE
jgi:hypothetical protein